ncbi:ATP-binding protein [Novipirellula caenicola]|uniref:histidine kinase n=1 Tax=Novipirellula caenicola TaxID=1536901 RepID=A0ABP9VTS4_9BACT
MNLAEMLEWIASLATLETRHEKAEQFARVLGIDHLIVFAEDTDVDQLLPIAGFPQTLPDGQTWQTFLRACRKSARHTATLCYPVRDQSWNASGISIGSLVIVLLGDPQAAAKACDLIQRTHRGWELFAYGVAGELASAKAARHALDARDAAEQSRRLLLSLDSARRELQDAVVAADQEIERRRIAEAEVSRLLLAEKQFSRLLAENEARLRLAARAAGFGTYYGDVQANQVSLSREFMQLLGLPADHNDTIRLKRLLSAVHRDDRDRVARKMDQSLDPSGNGEFQDEHRIVRPDGSVRWVMMRGSTVFAGDPPARHPSHIAGVAMDITERHRYEEQLKTARHAAEAANEAKSQFLANMSHEIRTPMTAILGFTELLNSRLQSREDKACLETIKANGDHLCEILNDILDLAKIEAGKVDVRRQPHRVAALINHVHTLLSGRAAEKGLEFHVQYDGPIPDLIWTDVKMLRQILINLVGNAIKFTDQGEVRIVVRCHTQPTRLEIAVMDTGIGIPPDDFATVFTPFEQLDNSATRQHGGTGLGLAITRRLVDLLGGTIDVESEVNKGSTFRFTVPTETLPHDQSSPTPATATPATSAASINSATSEDANPNHVSQDDQTADEMPGISGRILAVDDSRDIRFLVQAFVRAAGGEILSATNGSEGIQKWRSYRDKGIPIDAILMDMQMPVMDGITATKQLRDQGFQGPIIALTANALSRDQQRCLDAGYSDFLTKPIDRRELLAKLSHWLGNDAT